MEQLNRELDEDDAAHIMSEADTPSTINKILIREKTDVQLCQISLSDKCIICAPTIVECYNVVTKLLKQKDVRILLGMREKDRSNYVG